MALTKIRSRQTRAADEYSPEGDNLATDTEVENRVRKHSSIFHNIRNFDIKFEFNSNDDISKITYYKQGTTDVLKEANFTYNSDNDIDTITKEIFDNDLNSYNKVKIEFTYDNGDIKNIKNTVLS